MFRLPDFSVVVWVRRTCGFSSVKAELLDAALSSESTEYEGVDSFSIKDVRRAKHWGACAECFTRI